MEKDVFIQQQTPIKRSNNNNSEYSFAFNNGDALGELENTSGKVPPRMASRYLREKSSTMSVYSSVRPDIESRASSMSYYSQISDMVDNDSVYSPSSATQSPVARRISPTKRDRAHSILQSAMYKNRPPELSPSNIQFNTRSDFGRDLPFTPSSTRTPHSDRHQYSFNSDMIPIERSLTPSPDKLNLGKAKIREGNEKWKNTQSRYQTSRKAAEIYSKMAQALKELNEHSNKKDMDTADALDLLSEYVANDEKVDIEKMIEKNRNKVLEILETHDQISQQRHNVLRELKKWFDEIDSTEHLTENGAISENEATDTDLAKRNVDELLKHFKSSSNKLVAMQDHIKEMAKVMNLVKNNEVVPAATLRTSILSMESTFAKMKEDTNEAVKRYLEAEQRIQLLEEMLNAEIEKKKRRTKVKKQPFKDVSKKAKQEKVQRGNLFNLQDKSYSEYTFQLRTDIESRDRLLESQAEKIDQMTAQISEMEQDILFLRKECQILQNERDTNKRELDKKVQEIDKLVEEAYLNEPDTIRSNGSSSFVFTYHQKTQTYPEDFPEATTCHQANYITSNDRSAIAPEDSTCTPFLSLPIIDNELSDVSLQHCSVDSVDNHIDLERLEQYWLPKLSLVLDVLSQTPAESDIKFVQNVISDMKLQAAECCNRSLLGEGANTAEDDTELTINIDSTNMMNDPTELQIEKQKKMIESLSSKIREQSNQYNNEQKVLKNKIKNCERNEKKSIEEIRKLKYEVDKLQKSLKQVNKPGKRDSESPQVKEVKGRSSPTKIAKSPSVDGIKRKLLKSESRNLAKANHVFNNPITGFEWSSDEETSFLNTGHAPRRPSSAKEIQCELLTTPQLEQDCSHLLTPNTNSLQSNEIHKQLKLYDNVMKRNSFAFDPSLEDERDTIIINLEKRARQYVEQEKRHQIKQLMSDNEAYKMGHAFLHNNIESFIKDISREYPLKIVEFNEKDELDLKYQFESTYLRDQNDSSTFLRSELVLDTAQRMKILFSSMKQFIEEIYGNQNNIHIHEENLRDKYYELRAEHERVQAELNLMKTKMTIDPKNQVPGSNFRNSQRQHNLSMYQEFKDKKATGNIFEGLSLIKLKQAAEQLLTTGKLLKEAKAGFALRKMTEHQKLIQMQAQIYALKKSGDDPRLIAFAMNKERKLKELVNIFQSKKSAIEKKLVINNQKTRELLSYIVTSLNDVKAEIIRDFEGTKSGQTHLEGVPVNSSAANVLITSINAAHEYVTKAHKYTFEHNNRHGSPNSRKNHELIVNGGYLRAHTSLGNYGRGSKLINNTSSQSPSKLVGILPHI